MTQGVSLLRGGRQRAAQGRPGLTQTLWFRDVVATFRTSYGVQRESKGQQEA